MFLCPLIPVAVVISKRIWGNNQGKARRNFHRFRFASLSESGNSWQLTPVILFKWGTRSSSFNGSKSLTKREVSDGDFLLIQDQDIVPFSDPGGGFQVLTWLLTASAHPSPKRQSSTPGPHRHLDTLWWSSGGCTCHENAVGWSLHVLQYHHPKTM